MKYCPNCGKEIVLEDAKFCYECGFKLELNELDSFYKTAKIENGALKSYTGKEENVIVPGDISVIDKEAFSYNLDAKSITVSSGVTEIRERAFGHIPNVSKIFISDSVTKIDSGAFRIIYDNSIGEYGGCIGIEEIIVDENNPCYKSIDGSLYTKDGKKLIQYTTGKKQHTFVMPEGVVQTSGMGTFAGCLELKKIVLPSTFGDDEFILGLPYLNKDEGGFIEIEISESNPNYMAFESNVYSKDGSTIVMYNVTRKEDSFIIPKCVTRIDNCCFLDSELENIVIPNGVTEIGEMAFEGCYNLTSVALPSSVTEIGTSAFSACEYLESVALPSGLTKIEAHLFESAGLMEVAIPSSVREIGDYAFSGCSFKNLYVPSGVKRIGEEAFSYCADLVNVILPERLEFIGAGAFCSCNSLQSIKIPATVTEIGEYAFDDCDNLKKIYVVRGKKYENLPQNVRIVEY